MGIHALASGLAVAIGFLAPVESQAHEPHLVQEFDPMEPEIGQHDLEKGSKHGSPVEEGNLPSHIELLDIDLGEGRTAQRVDWSPDGKRLIFLDAPVGHVWEYTPHSKRPRDLTSRLVPNFGVLRAHHLSNGDVVLCGVENRSAEDPEGDRFRGQLWVLRHPLGRSAPVPLGEGCWEGVAVSKQAGSTRIAWNRSTIDFTKVPEVFVEAAIGQSQIMTGRIVYAADGTPQLVDKHLVLDANDVGLEATVEAQDFRMLDDGDADVDDELLFSAYAHHGGQVMGVNLETGRITDYSRSPWYEEPEGIDPAGNYILVERDLAIVVFPGNLDIWRLTLDGSGDFERLTFFNHYDGYGATNPVVSPDGTLFAFQLEKQGTQHGEGHGLLLFDVVAWDQQPNREVGPDPFLLPQRP